MSNYDIFSGYYDDLTLNISYSDRADYFNKLIEKHGGVKGILLDLACGTGSLSEEMSKIGYDVIGVDYSYEMLSVAMDKKIESGRIIQYICQDMTELDLYGTVDVTICALDSLNHLDSVDSIVKTVKRVKLFTNPHGLFIFDINTPYKHKEILGNNTFVYDTDSVFCVWQNSFSEDKDNRVDISLDFFKDVGHNMFSRKSEDFSEIAPEISVWKSILLNAGFTIEAVYDYDTFNEPKEKSEKVVFVAKT